MIFKENISKLSKSPQITFLLLSILLQEVFFIINYSDLHATMGYSKFSFFNFFIFLSTTLTINSIYFMILSLIALILIGSNKLSNLLIIPLEIIYGLFIFYDIKIYKTLGVHLYDNTVLAFLNKKSLENDILMTDDIFSAKTLIFLSSILISSIIIAVLVYYFSKKLSNLLNMPYVIKQFIAVSLLTILFSFFSYLRGYPILSIVPFYNIFENDINLEWIKPNYPNKISDKIKLNKTPNIVLILSESTRSDMQTPELMPNITEFMKENKNCIKSKHNFSGAHTTFPSLFSIIYGIYGYNNLFFNNQVTQTQPVTLKFLKDNNYETIFLTASSLKASYGLKKITKFFDLYKFFKYDLNGKPDIDMVNWFKEYYKKREKKPFFAIIFLRSPHYAYDYPKEFEKYKPVISLNDKNIALDSKYMSKKYKTQLFNRYKNSILFTDSLFKEITTSLKKEIDDKNLILYYTGDHGEEFWENGQFGHFSTSFIKQRVEVPFLFCLPDIKKTEVEVSTNTDFFSTVIDYMTEPPSPLKGELDTNNIKVGANLCVRPIFDGVSLLNPKENKGRFLIISTHSIAGTNTKMALVSKEGKINIKYSSRKISKIAKFTYDKVVDFDDKEINDKSKINKILEHLKSFEKTYTRFIKMK